MGFLVSGGGGGEGLFASMAIYQHEEDSQTESGDFNSGDWRTRPINTEVFDPDGIGSLASNQVTLVAGNYVVLGRAPAHFVDRHVTRLMDVTNATLLVDGGSAYAGSGNVQTDSVIFGTFILADSAAVELQHRCETTKTINGMGIAMLSGVGSGFAVNKEVYAQILFLKLS